MLLVAESIEEESSLDNHQVIVGCVYLLTLHVDVVSLMLWVSNKKQLICSIFFVLDVLVCS